MKEWLKEKEKKKVKKKRLKKNDENKFRKKT